MRVIGLGGIFFKCRDVEGARAWYARHLGISMESWGAIIPFKDDPNLDAYLDPEGIKLNFGNNRC